MAVNKVIFGDDTLIDLTADTVTSSALLSSYTAHDKSGKLITGTLVDEDNLERYGVVRLNTTGAASIVISDINPNVSVNITQEGLLNASGITINFRIKRRVASVTSGTFDVYLNNKWWALSNAVATTTSSGINISGVMAGEHFRFTLSGIGSLEVGITLDFVRG
ncbi:MAG: hypothetical protein HDQ95_00515 [Roseburia sp.]|nr:hypothetical protein [Roseburia sp.]